jgi:4-amino-4-deoxy-L-arabinose transferase-like glycosyltransferase
MEDNIDVGTKKLRGILAALSIFLVLMGLILLYAAPVQSDLIIMPPSLWLSAAGAVLFVVSNFVRAGRSARGWWERVPFVGAAGWLIAAIMLSIITTISMVAFSKENRVNYIPVITFWLAAGMCFLAAFGNNHMFQFPLRAWISTHRKELLAIGVVTLVGLVLRFYKLGQIPFVINGDEGRMGMMAQSTNAGSLSNPFALWENFGSLYLQFINFSIKLFGNTAFALRLFPAIGGVLAIPAIYLFARLMAGKRIALLSAALLAISHTHMHFSRTAAVGYIQATWLVPLELTLLFSGLKMRSTWRAALGGIILAIHFSIYITSQIVVVFLVVYLLVLLIFFRKWMLGAIRQVAAFWGGFVLMILPEATFIFRNPTIFLERLSMDGTFQSGWLSQTMLITGQSAIQVLAGRVLHAFLAIIYYPAIDFYGSPIPMLSIVTAALFILGLVILLVRRQNQETLLLNGYFWAFTLAVGLFSIPPSADSYRMLMALPAVLIMAAIGLDRVLEIVGLGWEKSRSANMLVTSVLLANLLVFNLWTYYDNFAGRCLYGDDLAGRFASYLGVFAHSVEKGSNIYLLSNDVFKYGTHASTEFLGQGRNIFNFPDQISQITLNRGDTLVASPDRVSELQQWALNQSQGNLHPVFDCSTEIMLIYRFP